MAFDRKSSGSNVTLTTFKRRASGAWVTLTTGKRRQSGVWVDILPVAGSTVALTNKALAAFGTSPSTASVVFRLATGGKLRVSINGGAFNELTPLTEWLDPEDPTVVEGSKYEAMATVGSNTADALIGTFGTWQQLGVAARDWGASITTTFQFASKTSSTGLTIQIRRIVDLVVVASASVTIDLDLASSA